MKAGTESREGKINKTKHLLEVGIVIGPEFLIPLLGVLASLPVLAFQAGFIWWHIEPGVP